MSKRKATTKATETPLRHGDCRRARPIPLGSYHFWKWAENDLPGKPAEVFAALMAGEMPPALVTFDAAEVLQALRKAAEEGRGRGEEWSWETVDEGAASATRYVSFTCPAIRASREVCERFSDDFSWLGLSGFDEGAGQVIPSLQPKGNVFIDGQRPAERYYDIEPADLPWLIKRLDAHAPDSFGIIENSRRHFAQCYCKGRRYLVEWAENHYFRDRPTVWDQWRAQDAERLTAIGGHRDDEVRLPQTKDPDLLRFSDTLAIMTAFLRGKRRPAGYPWRNVEHLVKAGK